jgi:Na+:H+ antiporter, NhaA family
LESLELFLQCKKTNSVNPHIFSTQKYYRRLCVLERIEQHSVSIACSTFQKITKQNIFKDRVEKKLQLPTPVIYIIFIKEFVMRIISSIKFFVKDSRAVGALLICSTVVSLIVSNSSLGIEYLAFWEQKITTSTYIHLPATVSHFINDALMSVFFFFAGLEIKREILSGELNTFKRSLMPVISAAGGMLFPAIIYITCCHAKINYMGWGIPMATDIAFSLGVLSLLGKRAPLSMRIFLTAIAIIDDIGGILTIAIFYAGQLNWIFLAIAAGIIIILSIFNYLKVKQTFFYIIGGIFLWYFIYNSGIHATIAGVILAFMIPSRRIHSLESELRIPVNFIILPLFALANTAIMLPTDLASAIVSPIHYGVFWGLFLGKPAGIFIATYIAVKMKLTSLPVGMTHKQVFGVGLIAGIGFTVSIFITMLAFADTESQLAAKLGVINASLCAGIAGYCFLRFARRKRYT